MPAFPRGWRGLFSACALFGALFAVATVFLRLDELHPALAVSTSLGAGAAFLLVAIAALVHDRERTAILLASPAALIAATGVAAYLLAYNGMSESLSRIGFLLITVSDAHMAGSLALLLVSVAVLLVATTERHGFGKEAMAASGFVAVLLVVAIELGQETDVVPLEAGMLAQELLPVESGLLLFGGMLLLFAAALFREAKFELRNRFLPALAFAALVTASFHLWLVLVGQEQLTIRQQTETTADRLAVSISGHFEERVRALERMAQRMTAGDRGSHAQWVGDARHYLADFHSMSAIGWVTPDGMVNWAVSRESDNYRVGEPYAIDAARREALARSRASGEVAFSEPLPLRAGGFGHIVALPLHDGERFEGWLVVGIRFAELFSEDVGRVAPGFAVRVHEGDAVIYTRKRDDERHPLAAAAHTSATFAGLEWRIEIWPERVFFGSYFLWLPGFMLTLGVLASLMFAISLYQLEAQRRHTASLRESEERFRLTALQTGELIYDYHVPSGRVEWAGAIEEITGETPAKFADVDIDGWIARLHPDDATYVLAKLEHAELALERFVCQYRFLRGDNRYVRVEDRGVFLPGPDGRAARMLGTMSDISERHEFEQQLRHLAHFDQQTGLRNRVWFMDDAVRQADIAERDGATFWCVLFDVDRFRAVNETLGHVVGDLLLEAVARRLESVLDGRAELARLGGDEFGLCVNAPDADRDAMAAFCEELIAEFAQPLAAGGHSLFVTLSIGVAGFPSHGREVQEVIRAAETAMFRSKQRGRNTYTFYEASMSAGARENLEIANALRRALERDEFHLVFQPRYSLSTGRVTGMEALLRWESAELGAVSPGVFIPVAEETGLIGPIGWYVVDAAAAAARRLGEDAMLGRRLAINVSARQLVQADFVAELVRRVREANARPHWFEIEITESLMMEDPERARELFERLHEHGFTVAIDDFGTGYSSLSYLKHFPADCLKVDRTFVMGLPDSKEAGAIVRTIIAMGQGLGMKLVAEGIETEAQSEFLQAAGCQEAQGFLFARPMPLAQLSVLLD